MLPQPNEHEDSREILLEHARRPKNRAPIRNPTHLAKFSNPICNDQVQVCLSIDEGHVLQIQALSTGCAICVASTSLISEWVIGQSPADIKAVAGAFLGALQDDPQAPWPSALKHLAPLSHLKINRMKIECSMVIWRALLTALFAHK